MESFTLTYTSDGKPRLELSPVQSPSVSPGPNRWNSAEAPITREDPRETEDKNQSQGQNLYMSYTSTDFSQLIYNEETSYDYEGPINEEVLSKVTIKNYKSTLDGIIYLLDTLKDKSIKHLTIKYYPASTMELSSMYPHVKEITFESAHTFKGIEDILLRFPNLETCKITSSLSKDLGMTDLSKILPKIKFVF